MIVLSLVPDQLLANEAALIETPENTRVDNIFGFHLGDFRISRAHDLNRCFDRVEVGIGAPLNFGDQIVVGLPRIIGGKPQVSGDDIGDRGAIGRVENESIAFDDGFDHRFSGFRALLEESASGDQRVVDEGHAQAAQDCRDRSVLCL